MRETIRADVAVLGGGTAGCVLAARLSEDPATSVCLVEGGPDYGARDEGGWPEDLLDARALPASHGWGFSDANASRARVIGGCSSHNACFVVWGHPRDYDAWSEPTGGAWTFESIEPYLRRAETDLRTRVHGADELAPWDRALVDAAGELGYQTPQNLNDLTHPEAAASYPVNSSGTVRWNAAFAYLDAARGRQNLEIVDRTLVDRLRIEDGRVAGVRLLRDGEERELSAGVVVLAAGTYGSPAVLLRSGIGPADELRRLGISPTVPLQGVGEGLKDHCGSWLEMAAGDDLLSGTATHADAHGLWQSASMLKARSGVEDDGYWDLQSYPWTERGPAGFAFYIIIKIQKVRSQGTVRLPSADPVVLPEVNHGFLSDPDGEDLARLVEGLKLARKLAGTPAIRGLTTGEVAPGQAVSSDEDITAFARANLAGHFHAVGTCAMGPAEDPMAVTDPGGRVHGTENLYVADASVFPGLPRANTNLTVVAVAERLAERLARGT